MSRAAIAVAEDRAIRAAIFAEEDRAICAAIFVEDGRASRRQLAGRPSAAFFAPFAAGAGS